MNMLIATAPKKRTAKKDLIVVPRRAYEEFLVWQKKTKSVRMFKPTLREKKDLARARKEFAEGKYITLAQLKHELERDR
ncbi:MAG: hypothetical protein Q8R30_02235 [bacterium]|nr:hypothetical protein [bacterium]MDZ4285386.1 hypothetical protein [Candidatus Sungbacteria bacterium]